MNKIEAKIKNIQKNGTLHLVELDANGTKLVMLSLELPVNFEINKTVSVLSKPSSVVLAKNFSGEISLINRIECQIVEIDVNEILSEILLSSKCGNFYALITKQSMIRMNLKVGDNLIAMIKATEISLGEI
jgi:molybdopterin-binding protein